MATGRAPVGYDNEYVELHHVTQKHNGAIAEVQKSFHNKYYSVIHSNTGKLPSNIKRSKFDTWRRNYWKSRAKDFM